MNVAVVILAYNNANYLKDFLPNVLSYSKEATIWVVDNASTDDTQELLSTNFPDVNSIYLDKNHGFAGGYNEGLAQIEADYYVLLNSDVDVTQGWLAPLIALAESDDTIGAIQPKIKSYNNQTYFEYAGACGGYIDKLGYPFCRGRIFDELEKDLNQYDSVESIFWASGACIFLNANLYHQLGGLDASYFAHMEEIDLCWRMQRAGFTIKVQPKSLVYHVGGGTLNSNNPKKTFLNFRNSLATLYKNHSHPFSAILSRLILDGVAGAQFLLKLKPSFTFAIIKAHMCFYKWFFSFLPQKRKRYNSLIKKYKIGDKALEGWYSKSIVKSFFIDKKKRFNQLDL